MVMKPRLAGLVTAVGLLIAAAIYTGYWFYAAQVARSAVEAWVDARRADGIEITHDGLSTGGFPFAVIIEMTAPAASAPRHPGAWRWRGDRLIARVRPWSLARVELLLPERQRLVLRRGDGERVIEIAAAGALATLDFSAGRLADAILGVAGLTITADSATTTIDKLDATLATTATDPTRFGLTVADMLLPTAPTRALGRRVARAEIASELVKIPPFLPSARALAQWRDAGGVVDARALSLVWGALSLEGDGTLTVDERMRPMGAFTMRVKGYDALIEALVAADAIRARDASLTLTILNLLAKRDDQGARVLTVPVTAQNGKLLLGPAKVLNLAPIPLPEG